MLEHLLGLEGAGVTRASRQSSGDKEQQALTAAIRSGHLQVSTGSNMEEDLSKITQEILNLIRSS